MKRDYINNDNSNVRFFVGHEVERTTAHGLFTLFVVGVQSIDSVQSWIDDFLNYEDSSNHIEHIFFGANHSYNPTTTDEYNQWDNLIKHFLENGYVCSLDIPINQVEIFNESALCDYNNFIPQIRIPIPYIKLWNYNTTIKIDDKTFNSTNPGVWVHSLHSLTNRSCFTDWREYKKDKVIEIINS